jgi:hypothetical protein
VLIGNDCERRSRLSGGSLTHARMSMARSVDYDQIAHTYDRRYQENDYSGVEAALIAFAGEHFDQRVLEVEASHITAQSAANHPSPRSAQPC